jgi:hypothetical protein
MGGEKRRKPSQAPFWYSKTSSRIQNKLHLRYKINMYLVRREQREKLSKEIDRKID